MRDIKKVDIRHSIQVWRFFRGKLFLEATMRLLNEHGLEALKSSGLLTEIESDGLQNFVDVVKKYAKEVYGVEDND